MSENSPQNEWRTLFPFFKANDVAYLDSAATSQKPESVLRLMDKFQREEYASIHRGAYALSAQSTARYEEARETVARFIGATDSRTVVFTRGCTESLNCLAHILTPKLKEGDTILITELEHHSNIVPWQLLAKRTGASVCAVPCGPNAEVSLESLQDLIEKKRPRVLSITQISNAFGSVLPVSEAIRFAKERGIITVVDAAQSVLHQETDVSALDCDFLAFSGHKVYGPTGIGVLYGRANLLSELPPFHGGGGMISRVSIESSSYADIPQKYEAGTPPITEALGLAEALRVLQSLTLTKVAAHEKELFEFAWEALSAEPGVVLHGPRRVGLPQASIISFECTDIHPHDLATIADSNGVQIRAGHHCAMPAMESLGLPATARLSLGLYSEKRDILRLVEAIRAARKVLRVA